jgi:prepilin-type N-terminal cleavage/methylation domain-containing protein
MSGVRCQESGVRRGFTLIELLIVISLVGVLAVIVLAAVDPNKRFVESRDSRRRSEANAILIAVLNYVVDNKGSYPVALDAAATSSQIIGTGTLCGGAALCNEATGGETVWTCANMTADLIDPYIGEMPIDPRGVDVNVATGTYDVTRSGYWINRTANGRIEVGSCNHEGTSPIRIIR